MIKPVIKMQVTDFVGYLRPDVIAEPLINHWYAWSYLISPATASRYLTQSQCRVMQSFIDAPQVHEKTLRDPAMMGGAFIQHPASRVDEVRSLLETTKREQRQLIGLSSAIAHAQKLLAQHPPGDSLEPLYAQIPEALKGYVELVYDAQNSASIRFIEGLMYRSEYYNPSSQSVALCVGDCDQRAFVMSTPRLSDESSLRLNLPFIDPRLDQLFQMRHKPGSVDSMAALLSIPEKERSFFYRLFTAEPPRLSKPYADGGIRVRYFGHACVLIETAEVSILCDPLISYEHPTGMSRYSYTDLPETIDYVLITHNHQDHVMLETLLQLRHKIKHLVVPSSQKGALLDPSLKLALQQIGFSQVLTLDELESVELPEGEIISIPVLGEHGDLNIATKNAYWIVLKGRSILCAADSNNLDSTLYTHIHHLLGDLDLLFLGMECDGAPFTWAYGPLLPNAVPHKQAQTRRLDGSNAVRAQALIDCLNPQQVYVYAMGQEPWLTYITSIDYAPDAAPIVESDRLIAACRAQGRVCDRLFGQYQITLSPAKAPVKKQAPIPVVEFSQTSHNQQLSTVPKPPVSSAIRSDLSMPADTLTPFLNHLQTLDVRLWLEGDILRCNAPKGSLTPALTAQLKENKPAIIALLKGSTVVSPQPDTPESFDKRKTAHIADWQKDVQLPAEIRPNRSNASSTLTNILLTGATGFLGAFLLDELLHQTEATIYCLIRASDAAEALIKLKQRLSEYRIWQPAFESRIRIIAGDLSQLYLGLSKQQFYTLSDQIDAIYHNGAQVHHISPYAQLRAANVLGTQEILRLACHGTPKPLHYTSTLSVLPPIPPSGQTKISEQIDLSQYPVPVGGYNRSKWVAEHLVAEAQNRYLPTTIYRPGPISGHSQTGVFNPNDFLYRLMQGYVQSGIAPEGETPLDLLPVDYAAKAIVYLSRQPAAVGKAFHLIHPRPAPSDLLFDACQLAGYSIRRVPYNIWHQKLQHIAKDDPAHPLYPLAALFASRQNSPENAAQTSFETSLEIPFDTSQTYSLLKDAPFDLPPLDLSLFNTYARAMLPSKTHISPPVLT